MVVNIVVNYRCKEIMLKETELKNNRLFCHILSLVTFRFAWVGPLDPPGYAYGALCHRVNPALVIALRS